MSDDDSDSIEVKVEPEEIQDTDTAAAAMCEVLSDASKDKYDAVYNAFQNWREQKNLPSLTEDVFLAYFWQLSKKSSPPTLWATYSMLRATMNTYQNVQMENFEKLREFIKKKNIGYKKKKANAFTKEQVEQFLKGAPDHQWLAIKAVLIVGIVGACRSCELVNLTLKDVQREGNILLIEIKDTKTHVNRSFGICKEQFLIVEKYRALRPKKCESQKFFVAYRNGKCVNQNIGKNTISAYPRRIAEYLELENPKSYTGHSYRRTAATLFGKLRGTFRTNLEMKG